MRSVGKFVRIGVAGMVMGWACESGAYWHRILEDNFSITNSSAWSYGGASNSSGHTLFRPDPAAQNVHAEWDQVNSIETNGDPYVIVPSRFSRPLGRTLTDQDTFRVGATLVLTPGSVNDTDQGFEIANFGLYNLAETGPDRCSADWDSTNTVRVKDAGDYVEFNYFVGNSWSGPNVCAAIGRHCATSFEDNFPAWYDPYDPQWPRNYCGVDNWLPAGTTLYVQVTYYGAATNAMSRRAYAAIYTEPARTNLLVVNSSTMEWWTPSNAAGARFTVTDMAFFNYVNKTTSDPIFGPFGPAVRGTGTWDDVYVDVGVDAGECFAGAAAGNGHMLSWGAVSGVTYSVLAGTNLVSGGWVTAAVLRAEGETVTWTNQNVHNGGYYRVTF
jgi:hypothetical protein